VTAEKDFDLYLYGQRLIGDDYDAEEIQRWFRDEKEGYAGLGAQDRDQYLYVYHALNSYHGFSKVTDGNISYALGIGSAYGDEFLPIVDRIEHLTIVEPSVKLRVASIKGRSVNYIDPDVSGTLPFESATFDLITCFGVLHHIPNVSYVVSEFSRVLKPGGLLLLREPIVSMGDWRKPRKGLTARERGIPKNIMENVLRSVNLVPQSGSYCDFSPLVSLIRRIGVQAPFNSRLFVLMDCIFSYLFSSNVRYHRVKLQDKFAPASYFWACRKSINDQKSDAR
jgi:SAM-dependent methyltransferase